MRKSYSRKVKTTNLYGFFSVFSKKPAGRQGGTIKKVITSYKGRRCKYPRCTHILSIYNHEAYCHIHLNQLPQERRAKVSK